MYKQLTLAFMFLTLWSVQTAQAQPDAFTASVDCLNHPNQVVASNMPPINAPVALWMGNFHHGGNPCRRIFRSANNCGDGSNQPLYSLERYNFATNKWEQWGASQNCATFSNLPHGTWRVKGQNPLEINGSGCDEGHIMVYDEQGKWLGYEGTFLNAPSYYTNIVTTLPTLANEIAASYIETYGTLDNSLFNYDETPKMNTTGTINYDRWWVAIYEKGGQNRSASQGWTFGLIPNNEINLKTIWNNAGYSSFAPITNGVTYDVQFAIAGPCNTTWVESGISNFGVCLQGMNCRGVFDESEISLSPNPANSTFHLSGLDMAASPSGYRLKISDLSGRMVKEFTQLEQEVVDVSDLANGLYAVSLFEGERPVKTFKLSIVR